MNKLEQIEVLKQRTKDFSLRIIRLFQALPKTDENELKKFVEWLGSRRNKVIIEWSGNVDLKTIEKIKGLPVDRVSVGAITHSAKAVDFSLKII